ncbi:MAG: hypothetical protein QM777_16250 [Pseudorhodoferax sp.]
MILAQLVRTVAYSGAGSALWALLPIIGQRQLGLGADGLRTADGLPRDGRGRCRAGDRRGCAERGARTAGARRAASSSPVMNDRGLRTRAGSSTSRWSPAAARGWR